MAGQTLVGGSGSDTLLGGDDADSIVGAEGNDSLRGGRGRNTLEGGLGNDSVIGDWDSLDRLDGGAGDDWIWTDGSGTLLGADGSDTLQAFRDDELADLLEGGAGDDQLNGRSAGSTLRGGDGNDQVNLTGAAATLEGGAGNDTLWGSTAGALLLGGIGNDELRAQSSQPGQAGTSTLIGGVGDDHYVADSPQVQVIELAGEGQDTVSFGFAPGVRVEPIAHVEVLRVGASVPFDNNPAPMVLAGNDAANHLIAAGPRVIVEGAGGNDRLVAEAGFVTLFGGAGNDLLQAVLAASPVRMDGGEGDDTLEAGGAGGVLLGGDGNDSIDAARSWGGSLVGGAGDDVLRGGGGSTLVGGPGRDTLIGSAAVFRIDDPNDVIQAESPGNQAEVALSGWWPDPRLFSQVRHVDGALPVGYWLQALIGEPLLPFGSGGELTFTLPQATEIEGFSPFGAADRAAVHAAFSLWSAGTRLTVREVVLDGPVEPGEVDIAFGFADLSEAGLSGLTVTLPELGLTVVLIDLPARGGLTQSDARWNTVLLHEVGHALGLKHPGNYGPAAGDSRPPYLPRAEDSTRFTLLSYNEPVPRGAADFVTTLPALDRAVMRAIYGQADGPAAGNTVWTFDATGQPTRWIEDSSGIDTLDAQAAGSTGVTLDLRVGGRSFVGTGAAPALVTLPGQSVVGHGSVLEHAIGGAGADRLFGNEGANRLQGGEGADTLLGALGDDTLEGGAGDDQLNDSTGANVLLGGDGDDLVVYTFRDEAGAGFTQIDGGPGQDRLELRIPGTLLDDTMVDRLVLLRQQLGAGDSAAPWRLQLAGIESLLLRDSAGQPLPNQAPRARDGSVTTPEDVPVSGRLPEAFDFEGDLLGYGLLTAPIGFELLPDGRYTYTPPPGWSGVVEANYRVSDGVAWSAARFMVTVTNVDDAPVLLRTPSDVDAVVGVPFATHLQFFNVRDEDTPVLSYSLRRADGLPLPAWLQFDPATWSLSGTPAAADSGVWRLELVARDTVNAVAAPFLFGVHAVPNRDPEAPQRLQAVEDEPFVGRLPATDADGDPLRYELLSTLGSVSQLELAADGSLRMVPPANFWGEDNFLVRASDGRGGSAEYFVRVDFKPVDDVPENRLVLRGEPKVGSRLTVQGGVYDPDNVFALGPGRWMRGDALAQEVLGNPYELSYLVTPEDVGALLRYEVRAVDPLGNPVTGSVALAGVVQPMGELQGTAGAERLRGATDGGGSPGWDAASRVFGGAGNDTLIGGFSFDRLEGGSGDDVLAAGKPGTVVEGGEGFDTFVMTSSTWMRIDLRSGVVTDAMLPFGEPGPREMSLAGIEAVAGTFGNERFFGLDGPANRWGESFKPVGGLDTVDGGSGIDTVELSVPRAAAQLQWQGEVLRVTLPYPDGVELTSVERLRFDDILLAFGTRAIEIAQVAFALWSKGIAAHPYLFGRGISFYDVGYSFDEMVAVALGFFTTDSEQQFAERLASNVASGRSAAELLGLMQANGGAGAGQAGRVFATKLVATHPDNLANIELAGFLTQGVPCALYADGNLLFAPIGSLGP